MEALMFNQDRLKAAFGELITNGLADAENNKRIVLRDINSIVISRRESSVGSSTRYTLETLNSETDREFREALVTISSTFFGGNMSPSWYDVIYRWKGKLEPEVLVLLFEHCTRYCSGVLTKAYVEKVAESWAAQGIKTVDQLEEYFTVREKLNRFIDFIRKKMNRRTEFMDSDVAVIRKWLEEYRYGEGELSVVLERTGFSNPTIRMFDKIVTEWHEKGLKNAEEIRKYEEEKRLASGENRERQAKPAARNNKSASGRQAGARGNFTQREYDDDFYSALISGSSEKRKD